MHIYVDYIFTNASRENSWIMSEDAILNLVINVSGMILKRFEIFCFHLDYSYQLSIKYVFMIRKYVSTFITTLNRVLGEIFNFQQNVLDATTFKSPWVESSNKFVVRSFKFLQFLNELFSNKNISTSVFSLVRTPIFSFFIHSASFYSPSFHEHNVRPHVILLYF